MKLSQIKLDQTVTIAQEAHCLGTATRLSERAIELRYYAGAADDLVLKTILIDEDPHLNTGDIDMVFWNILVDGHPATWQDLEDVVRRGALLLNIDARTRTLDFMKAAPAREA